MTRWIFTPVLGCMLALTAAGCAREPREPARAPLVRSETTTTSAATTPQGRERSVAAVRSHVSRQLEQVQARCGAIPREIDRYEATLHLEISAAGRVEVARARGNHPLVDACVSDLARTWTFDAAGERTVTDVALALTR